MQMGRKLHEFSLKFEAEGQGYATQVQRSPAGEGRAPFVPPCSPTSLSQLRQQLSALVPASGRHQVERQEAESAASPRLRCRPAERHLVPVAGLSACSPHSIGRSLFQALFAGKVKELHDQSVGYIHALPQGGLRLSFHMDLFLEAPTTWLAGLPWELLCSDQGDYLALNPLYSIVRWPESTESLPPPQIQQPIEILILVVNPRSLAPLGSQSEAQEIEDSFRNSPSVHVTRIEAATTEDLGAALLHIRHRIDILHFIGHGDYDNATGKGMLYFETPAGGLHAVDGQQLKHFLGGQTELQLIVLNACMTANFPLGGGRDPLSGVATSLLAAGFRAVIAMQFPISDGAAIAFSRGLYARLAAGEPLDAAMVEGRRAILFRQPDSLEWSTPALFMRVRDGEVFQVEERRLPRRTVLLEVQKDRDEISEDYERSLIEAFAGFLKIAPTDLEIRRERSTGITLKLPEDAVRRLLSAAESHDQELEQSLKELSVARLTPTFRWPALFATIAALLIIAVLGLGLYRTATSRAVSLDAVGIPAGWMSEQGQSSDPSSIIQLSHSPQGCHTGEDCVQVQYQAGATWSGVVWWPKACGPKGTPEAWERAKSCACASDLLTAGNFSRVSKVSFWARGERGGEVVEFRVGDDTLCPRPGRSSGLLTLSTDWKQYEIDLTGIDMKQAVGLFMWIATDLHNPSGATFYLDDVQFEGKGK
jgi:CHAT domain-containing protein